MISTGQLNGLKSDNQMDVAMELSDMLLEVIKDKDENVAQKLASVRDLVWSKNPIDEHKREEVFKAALVGLDEQQTRMLCEAYVHMGELYEVAGLSARDNYFKQLRDKKQPVPGGAEEFIKNKKYSMEDALAKLAVPVFEVTMTMHPTNVQGLPPMKALRKIATALHSGAPTESIREAIREYQSIPTLHMVDGKESNLTVRDETKSVLNSLGNIYEDLPGIFQKFDDPFTEKYKANYDPLALKLNARFGSWGSAGDKDGNDNVTAEKTLEAIARHTHDIVERYIKDMEEIKAPKLENWKAQLKAVYKTLDGMAWEDRLKDGDRSAGLLPQAEALSDATDKMRTEGTGYSKVFNKTFDYLSKELAGLRDGLDAKKFEDELSKAYLKQQSTDTEDAQKLLGMVRKVRWFGFNFSKIEYRETAFEHEKVLDNIIPGYAKLAPDERVKTLDGLLNAKELPQGIKERVSQLLAAGADKPLTDKKDTAAIAYHTLKRMELARDHGGIIKDMVLAECGALDEEKYKEPTEVQVRDQGVANLLEAKLLQRLVEQDGKKPLLGIVPLFEDPSTMQNIDKIMESAYKNPAYHQHLEQLATDRYDNKITQQVQIAHSDNRRRAGSLAGTAFIHEAHSKLRRVNEANGVQTQFFEGGSLCDPFRNGVRALSAQVNAFGLHDFAKFTFQGRDLLNYFNHPGSSERMFTRNFVHPAEYVLQNGENTWAVNRNAKVNGNSNGNGAKRAPNSIIEDIAIAALKKTLDDYSKQEKDTPPEAMQDSTYKVIKDFTLETMGVLFAVLGLGYKREATAANRGSRAAARVEFSGNGTAKTEVGAVIQPVGLDKLRTIPFSMFPQQNRMTLSWVGGQNLEKYLKEEIFARLDNIPPASASDIDYFTQNFAQIPRGSAVPIPPKCMNILYEKSPTFRDAIDKTAFALARTDMPAVVEDVAPKLAACDGDEKTMVKIRENEYISMKQVREYGRNYVEHLSETCGLVGNLVYAAIVGKPLNASDNAPNSFTRYSDRSDKNQASLVQALNDVNGLGGEIDIKNKYQDFIIYAKTHLGKQNKLGEHDELLAVLLAGGLTSTHSRWMSADDPSTAKHRLDNATAAVAIH